MPTKYTAPLHIATNAAAEGSPETRRWLRAVHPDDLKPGERIEIRTYGTRSQSLLCATHDDALAKIAVLAQTEGLNIAVGMGLRSPDGGKAENLLSCSALWVDLDCTPGPGWESDRAAAIETLQNFSSHPPQLIVDSGNGYHGYWFLEPFSLREPEERQYLKNTLRGLAKRLDGDCAVVDSSRIMRVAGTTNFPDEKKRAAGRVTRGCRIVPGEYSTSLYSLDDFSDFGEQGFAAFGDEEGLISYESPAFWDRKIPASVAALLKKCPQEQKRLTPSQAKLVSRWGGDVTGLSDPSRSGSMMSIATLLAIFKIPAPEIETALRFWTGPDGHCQGGAIHPGKFTLTVRKAVASAKASDEKYLEKRRVDAHDQGTQPIEDETEDGIALRFVRKQGAHFRFCAQNSQWYAYTGGAWAIDDTQHLERGVRQEIQSMAGDVENSGDADEIDRWLAMVKKARRWNVVRNVASLAGTDEALCVRIDEFDADGSQLNTSNGLLDLATGALTPHRPEALQSRQTRFPYNPDVPCPVWEKYLLEAQPDPEVRDFLQRVWGYALGGSTVEESVFFSVGGGANGKSTAIETISYVLGSYSMTLPATTLLTSSYDAVPNDIAKLPGVRFASIMETDESRKLNEARIKSLASGEVMPARFMRKEWFEFTPVAKFFLTTNHKPQVRGTDEGIWRRLKLIDWPSRFVGDARDVNLKDKLRTEGEGILAWLVRGHAMWSERGLEAPSSVTAATEVYRSEEDVIGEFLGECCIFGPDLKVTNRRLWPAYKQWADANGHKTASVTKFGRDLEAKGYAQGALVANQRTRKGLDLKVEAEAQGSVF